MEIILDIEDSRFDTFLDLVKTLDYVSVRDDITIPKWQQKEVSRRLQLIDSGEMKTRSWKEARADIFKK